jgi:hypothetical protein
MGAVRFDNVSRTARKVGMSDAWAVLNAVRHVVRAGLVSRRHWSNLASINRGREHESAVWVRSDIGAESVPVATKVTIPGSMIA